MKNSKKILNISASIASLVTLLCIMISIVFPFFNALINEKTIKLPLDSAIFMGTSNGINIKINYSLFILSILTWIFIFILCILIINVKKKVRKSY